MHPDVSASDDIVAGANQETLLSFALRGLMSDREAAAAGLLPFEAFDYLNDDLQNSKRSPVHTLTKLLKTAEVDNT